MARSDVLIVNPPSPDGHVYIRDICRWGRKSREGMIWPQTSLAYLAAMVPDDLSVRLIDAIAEGMPWDRFARVVSRQAPLIYVTYVTGTTFEIDARGIRLAKGIGATTIAIGTHPSAVPRDTLERIPELDVVIRHEPEMTFREVVDRIRKGQTLRGCLGTAVRDEEGRIVVHDDRPLVPHLDDLPIPKQHLLPLDRYRMPFVGKRYTWVLTNRGCPYRCTYCFEGVVWGKSVRCRSAESVVRELEYLAAHNVRNIIFLADLFTCDREGVMRLCELILNRGLRVRWACNSRVDTIDEPMARRMREAGCWLIAFGIESGSQAVLDACRKDTTVEKARETVSMVHRTGIKAWGYFIIGLPGETRATIRETIDFAKSLPLDIALFHVAVPYAGTEFYFQAVRNGWLDTNDWSCFDMNDSAVVRYPDLAPDTIVDGVKRAYREFYFRPRQIWQLVKMTAHARDVAMLLDGARGFVRWLLTFRGGVVAGAMNRAASDNRSLAAAGTSHGASRDGAVLESTHSSLGRTKRSHRAYREITGENADSD